LTILRHWRGPHLPDALRLTGLEIVTPVIEEGGDDRARFRIVILP